MPVLGRIERRAKRWLEAGIIDAQQQQSILDFEQQHEFHISFSVILLVVGLTAVLCGLVAVISANWELIPRWSKLVNYFLLLTILGGVFFHYEATPGPFREALIWAFVMVVLAGIGLIAQLFNLSGPFWKTGFLYAVLILPMVLLAGNALLPHGYCFLLLTVVFSWHFAWCELPAVYSTTSYLVVTCGPPLLLSFYLLSPPRWHQFLLPAAFVRWLVVTILIGASFWGSALLYVPLGFYNWKAGLGQAIHLPVLAGACLACAWFRSPPPGYTRVHYAVYFLLLESAAFICFPILLPAVEYKILATLWFMVHWGVTAWIAIKIEHHHLLALALGLLLARIVAVLIEVFGTLLLTGTGLLFFGVFVLLATWSTFRSSKRLFQGGAV